MVFPYELPSAHNAKHSMDLMIDYPHIKGKNDMRVLLTCLHFLDIDLYESYSMNQH